MEPTDEGRVDADAPASPPPCKFFRRGHCKHGDKCRFAHVERRPRNTETFRPSYAPADMRVQAEMGFGLPRTRLAFQTRDVGLVYGLFCHPDDMTLYNRLLDETRTCGISPDRLWKPWHGSTHLIADDHARGMDGGTYRVRCPTFQSIVDRLARYFDMDVQATRLNFYRGNNDWKPFHHDAAYTNPEKARLQNFTVGVSFGTQRDIAFEDAVEGPGHRRVVSFPVANGSVYFFSRDINVNWRHGVPVRVAPPDDNGGRVSIILWGSVTQQDV